MSINLVCVAGGDTSLLSYAIEHYRALGVDSFHIVRQVESYDDPSLGESIEVARSMGVEFARICVGPWHEELNSELIRKVMDSAKNDWWVVADLDEFHVYDRPLKDVIERCEDGGYDYVMGAFLDRVAENGDLRTISPFGVVPIWEQFPLAGLLTFRVLGGVPTKVTLARGAVELDLGQHRAWHGLQAPADEFCPQVHHFKWSETVRTRLEKRVAAYSSGYWKSTDTAALVAESKRILDHIRNNDGRIDVGRPDCMFQMCGTDYGDYAKWLSVIPLWNDRYSAWAKYRVSTRLG